MPERAPKKTPGKPQRKPRELRLKDLVKALRDEPIDVCNPRLPAKHLDRFIEILEGMKPSTPWRLTPEQVREAFGEDLAMWFENNWRKSGRHA